MITTAKLAGFLAAHADWSVSDGETLIPMLGYTAGDNTRRIVRLAMEDLAVAVERGKQKLEANDMDADDAVIRYDGRMSLHDTTVDAIIVEMRAYFSPESRAIMAIPHTPPSSGAFRVHKPKLLVWEDCEDCEDFDLDAALESFFAGVADHGQGAKVWNTSLDERR